METDSMAKLWFCPKHSQQKCNIFKAYSWKHFAVSKCLLIFLVWIVYQFYLSYIITFTIAFFTLYVALTANESDKMRIERKVKAYQFEFPIRPLNLSIHRFFSQKYMALESGYSVYTWKGLIVIKLKLNYFRKSYH